MPQLFKHSGKSTAMLHTMFTNSKSAQMKAATTAKSTLSGFLQKCSASYLFSPSHCWTLQRSTTRNLMTCMDSFQMRRIVHHMFLYPQKRPRRAIGGRLWKLRSEELLLVKTAKRHDVFIQVQSYLDKKHLKLKESKLYICWQSTLSRWFSSGWQRGSARSSYLCLSYWTAIL